MSGKRARNFRKKNFLSKKVLALCAGLCFSCVPLAAESEILVSAFSPFTKPFGGHTDSLGLQMGNGGGLKITYRPVKNIDIFAQGEYISISRDTKEKLDPISILDASLGAGYHFILTDRLSFDVSANGGVYSAKTTSGDIRGIVAGLSMGISYKVSPVIALDATVSGTHFVSGSNPLMAINAGVSPGVTFDITQLFNKATKIDMEVAELAPIFPALYSWYEKNPFGKVTITNNEDTAITDITVSFFQPQYMAHAKECMTIRKIEKNESVDVDLIAFFNEQMLELTELSETNSIVVVNYLYLGQKRTKSFALDVPVYGRNNMSWDDDRRAAVFVSSKDPAAMRFAKYVTSIVRKKKRSSVPLNIQYAMGIFEALNEFGINYVVDPSSAFEDNIGTSSIDFLQFPYQTLMFKGGDCDDLSILVCSLFESVGIRTAFITIPGHIFMAFDSGMNAEQAGEVLRNPGNYIDIDGEIWIPLEITLSDEGFYRAYRYGAREWNKAYSDGTAAIYRMQDSWKIYPPISVPGATEKFTMPANKQISLAFEKSVDQWSFAELKDILSLRPVKLAEATEDSVKKEEEAVSAGSMEDPFAASTLYEVLKLSGQAVAMSSIPDVKMWRNDSAVKLEDEEEETDEAIDNGGMILPVIAVNVPGPEELGIIVPGSEMRTLAKLDGPQNVGSMIPEASVFEKNKTGVRGTKTEIEAVKPKESKTEIIKSKIAKPEKNVAQIADIKSEKAKTSVKTPISVDSKKIDIAVESKDTPVKKIINIVTEPDASESKASEVITADTAISDIRTAEAKVAVDINNETHKSESTHIPVLPIVAATFTLLAAAGILIAEKKRKSGEEGK